MTTISLTDKESTMIREIATSEYHDEPGEPVWTDIICEDRADAAVLGSLIKKGLANSTAPMGKVGSCSDATCWLTDSGVAAFREMTA